MSGTTGDNLRAERNRKGMSQGDLSAKSGFSKSFISAVETGHQSPRLTQLTQLAIALDVPVEALIGQEVAAA